MAVEQAALADQERPGCVDVCAHGAIVTAGPAAVLNVSDVEAGVQ
jgi:hypothetical protein